MYTNSKKEEFDITTLSNGEQALLMMLITSGI